MSIDKSKPTERFTDRAKLYSQARPDYPTLALDFVCEHCCLSAGKTLVDIGAGTGISSRAFASRGVHVTAVEPNQAMLEEAKSHSEFSGLIDFVSAKAEETGLPSGKFDAILCAQAFHWFDPSLALSEFNRILKEGAWVVLIWNERDEKDSFTRSYGELLRTLPETSGVEMKRGAAAQPLMDSAIFTNQSKTCFEHSQRLDLNGFLGRAFSSSYVPAQTTAEGEAFTLKLKNLFDQNKNEGSVVLKYECSVYAGQK